ncbi:MAG: AMP-binding protein [Burkholderiaceae bacterium]|nr:AMP-binding protein [Burkholderiaceae bacterium]
MYSEIHDPRRWLLTEALDEHANRSAELEWLADGQGGTLSFGQARTHSLRAAGFFERLGVRRAERVGMFMFNSCAFATAWLSLAHLGATAVLFNTELRGSFLRHQLNDSQVGCLVVDAELLEVVNDLADDLPHLRTVVVVGDARAKPHESWNAMHWPDWNGQPDWSGPAPAPEDIACVMYTSGTTGPSKGVLMPHAHCTLLGIGAIESLRLDAHDRYYICLPLFHANGLFMQLGATLLAGIPAFVQRRFSASRWLSDIRDSGATVTNLLGATASFVFAQPPSEDDRSHRLRAVMLAPNPAEHDALFRSRFGIRDVVSGFGMTEVNIPIWGRLGQPAPGAAGWTSRHFEVCIADPDTDMPVPPGQMGEILVRPRVPFGFMAGYLNAPEKTVQAWRNLWFHTGDAGTMREDGLVTFVDRIKDCIRRRGENISATEVEEVVRAMRGVGEVAVYAVPSDIPGGEDEVMLAIVPRPDASLDAREIAERAAEQLPRFAKPRYVRLLQELPKTATGKIQRAVLRQQGTSGAIDVDSSVQRVRA